MEKNPPREPREDTFWELYSRGGDPRDNPALAGGALAALRRGRHAEPGEEPGILPFYTTLSPAGTVTRELRAEHACLVLYGVHQQGLTYPVHQKGVSLGQALAEVRASDRFSRDALDEHVQRLLTSTSLAEAVTHLHSLFSLLRATKLPIRLDYQQLMRELVRFQYEDSVGSVRRRWGSAYFHQPAKSDTPTDTTTTKE